MHVQVSRKNLFGDDVEVLTVKRRRRHIVMGGRDQRRLLCNNWRVVEHRCRMEVASAIDCANCRKVIRMVLFQNAKAAGVMLDGPDALEVFADMLLEMAERGERNAMVAYRLAMVALHGRVITSWMKSSK
jgi:hypothetical protein